MFSTASDWAAWALDIVQRHLGQGREKHLPRAHVEVLEDRVLLSVTPGPDIAPAGCACAMCAPGAEYRFSNNSTSTVGAAKWAQPNGLGSTVTITYSYANLLNGGLGGGLSAAAIRSAIEEALSRWAAVAPLRFIEVADSGPAFSANMSNYSASNHPMLRFGHVPIDGRFNTLAYAYYPGGTGLAGDVFFDSGEVWSTHPSFGIDLIEVAVHEIGHALGIGHEPMPTSGGNQAIMNPYYGSRYRGPGTSFLYADDINAIRALYGTGIGAVVPLNGPTIQEIPPAPTARDVTGPTFSDNFNRTNSVHLGPEWTDRVGDFQLRSNAAAAMSNGTNLVTLNGYMASDVSVQARVNIQPGQIAYAGLIARYTGLGDANYYYADLTGVNGVITARIYRNVGGSFTLLASSTLASGVGTMRFEVVGGTQKLFFNSGSGEHLVAVSNDTLLSGAGTVGLRAHGAPGVVTYDDFAVERIIPLSAVLPYGPDGFAPTANQQLGRQWREVAGNFRVDGVLSNRTQLGLAVLNGISERDVTVQARVNIQPGQIAYAGLIARYTGPGDSNYYYADITGVDGSVTVRIFRNVGGAFTLLASNTLSSGVGTLRFEVVGTTQRLFFNDGTGERLVAVANDASILAPGTVGVRAHGTVSYDDFAAQRITALSAVLPYGPDGFAPTANQQLGRQWTEQAGNFRVDGVLSNTTQLGLAVLNGISERDVSVQARVNIQPGQAVYAGLIARYTGPGDSNYYYADISGVGGVVTVRIFRNVGGAFTLLASNTLSSGVGTLRFEVVGTTQKLFFNDGTGERLVALSNDTSISAPGTVGVRAHGAPGTVSYDDFAAQRITALSAVLPYGPDGFAPTANQQLGRQWTERAGNFRVDGVLSNTTQLGLAVLNGVSERDVSVQARVNIQPGQAVYAGLIARYTGPGDSNYYYADITGVDGVVTVRIFRNVGGAFTLLASNTLTSGVGTLRFEVVGTTQRLFFNNGTGERLVALSNDASILAPGTVGVRAHGVPGTVIYDDFRAVRIGSASFTAPAPNAFSMTPETSRLVSTEATVAIDRPLALAAGNLITTSWRDTPAARVDVFFSRLTSPLPVLIPLRTVDDPASEPAQPDESPTTAVTALDDVFVIAGLNEFA